MAIPYGVEVKAYNPWQDPAVFLELKKTGKSSTHRKGVMLQFSYFFSTSYCRRYMSMLHGSLPFFISIVPIFNPLLHTTCFPYTFYFPFVSSNAWTTHTIHALCLMFSLSFVFKQVFTILYSRILLRINKHSLLSSLSFKLYLITISTKAHTKRLNC